MKKIMILALLLSAVIMVWAVPAAQAHKPKPHKVYHYGPPPCPPPAVVHHYYPYAGYRYAPPPPPPRRVEVYHHYYPCYPYCGYYSAPRRPYVGGYVGDAGWSLIFETGGRW
uniref:Transmembrane protein n=1 Tax=Desulfacinum infernum TaxID=35837 RepID=A0A832EIG5_9BACT